MTTHAYIPDPAIVAAFHQPITDDAGILFSTILAILLLLLIWKHFHPHQYS